ncbi:MerR family transcriptional regulator [Calditrichota bacterium]
MNGVNGTHNQRLLSIGQVTAITGVGRSTLRHWEKEFGEFLDSVRTEGNQRRFTPDAVKKIEKIKTLVEKDGLTLRGVRKRLETVEAQAEQPEAKAQSVDQLATLVSEHVIRKIFRDN